MKFTANIAKIIKIDFKVLGLIILALILVLFGIKTLADDGKQKYYIPENLVYKENVQILEYKDQFVILSTDNNSTIVTGFSSSSGESKELLKLQDIPYIEARVFNQSLVIAYVKYEMESGFPKGYTEVATYNLEELINGNVIKENAVTLSVVIDRHGFELDNYGCYYLLNKDNRKQIRRYDPSEFESKLCSSQKDITSLTKSPQGSIYACYDGNQGISQLSFKNNCLTLKDFENNQLNAPVCFTDENTAVDYVGKVFKLDNENLSYAFDTCSGKNTVCSYEDNLLTLCSPNLLILLDKNTGDEILQFSLDNTPIAIKTKEDTVLSFGFEDDNLLVETLTKPQETEYMSFNEQGNVFIPIFPKVEEYDIKDFDESALWSIQTDLAKISVGKRSQPCVTIINKDTGDSYIRTVQSGDLEVKDIGRELIFLGPDEIEAGTYEVVISGVVDNETSRPAKLIYNIEFIYNPDSSDDPSGERIITSDVYNIDRENNIITGISPETTLAQFKKNIKYKGTIYAISASGSNIKSGKIGTGANIYLLDEEEEYDHLSVVIYGDLTGESNINSRDVQAAFDYLLGEDVLDELQLRAFDVNHDGEMNTADLVLLNRAFLNNYQIDQQGKS